MTAPAAAGLESPATSNELFAVIDIGSNTIRLVVYDGLSRTPAILLNEKMVAALGSGLGADNHLSAAAMDLALSALARFRLLCEAMGVTRMRAVATAAMREAANGAAFARRIAAETGILVDIIDGPTEAVGAAMGVIAGIPGAHGVVGDLGGGSLELVHVSGGRALDRISLPLGTLRLDALRGNGWRRLARHIEGCLDDVAWATAGRGLPFYAVGGSWRALAHLHMHLTDWPLPIVHQYTMPTDAPHRLVHSLAQLSAKSLKAIPSIPSSRAGQLPGAATLLRAVTRRLGSSAIITSAYGLREGLVFQLLSADQQNEDPLLCAARGMACRLGRFSAAADAEVGEALMDFIDPLFTAETAAERRIRHAAALLADSSWRAHPELRAEDGMNIALHGSWAGIDAQGRAMLAAALWAVNGGSTASPALAVLARLAPPEALALAISWGLALRLGQRLGGGTAAPLRQARLVRDDQMLGLYLPPAIAALYGGAVARRHRALAQMLRLEPKSISG